MESPDLKSFDWILINSSAGKDSQTTLAETVRQADAAGVPRGRLVVVHCDLGRVEWAGTRDLARRQAEHYGLRFEVVKRTQNDLLEHVRARGKWPGPGNARYCTSDHKRGPVLVLMTALAKETRDRHSYMEGTRLARRVRILNVMGMRAQESDERAKLAPYELNKRATNGRRIVLNWLPIHGWTLEQVWADIKASGVPYHQAYDLGMPRLSCCFCIYADRDALIVAGKHNPALLAEYVRVEREISHKFKADLSLVEIQNAVQADQIPAAVADWRM